MMRDLQRTSVFVPPYKARNMWFKLMDAQVTGPDRPCAAVALPTASQATIAAAASQTGYESRIAKVCLMCGDMVPRPIFSRGDHCCLARSAQAKAGLVDEAIAVFEEMQQPPQSVRPDLEGLNTLLNACARALPPRPTKVMACPANCRHHSASPCVVNL